MRSKRKLIILFTCLFVVSTAYCLPKYMSKTESAVVSETLDISNKYTINIGTGIVDGISYVSFDISDSKTNDRLFICEEMFRADELQNISFDGSGNVTIQLTGGEKIIYYCENNSWLREKISN